MTEQSPQDWARLVRLATTEAVDHLGGVADRDWTAAAGDLKWSCWTTAAHVADDLFAYAGQVVAQPLTAYLPFELRVATDTSAADVVTTIAAGGELLALAVAAAEPDARAWHSWGMSDGGGFAAMGVTELLVHSYDIGRGLGCDWLPSDALAAPAVTRLFPGVPDWPRAGERLLWCTGRIPLGDHPRRASDWRWDPRPR